MHFLGYSSCQGSFKLLKGGSEFYYKLNLFHCYFKNCSYSLGPLELLAFRGGLAKLFIFVGPQLLLSNEDACTHSIEPLRKGNNIRGVKALEYVKGPLNVGMIITHFSWPQFLLRMWFWHAEMVAKKGHSFKKYPSLSLLHIAHHHI